MVFCCRFIGMSTVSKPLNIQREKFLFIRTLLSFVMGKGFLLNVVHIMIYPLFPLSDLFQKVNKYAKAHIEIFNKC